MAAASGTYYVMDYGTIGQNRYVDLAVDITTGGADGLALDAGSGPLTGWSKIKWVTITGAVETGGYVEKFVVDAEVTADGQAMGDGDFIVYESDDAVDPLDASTDNSGVFYARVEGY